MNYNIHILSQEEQDQINDFSIISGKPFEDEISDIFSSFNNYRHYKDH